MNWLHPTHPAHSYFERDLAASEVDLLGASLDWDTQAIRIQGQTLPTGMNIVGPRFYDSCRQKWLALDTTRDQGPWPGGGLVPPFAKSVDIQRYALTGGGVGGVQQ